MLSTLNDDWVSLTFDAGSYDFLNVGIDISAIDLDGLAGPFGVAQPIFRVSLYDSPGGAFNINSPGTLLDQHDITGTGTPDNNVYDWTSFAVGLDTTGTVDGHVSLVLDLRQSGYAAFDNLRVAASDISGDLGVPEPSTYLAGTMLAAGVAGACWKARRRARSV